MSEDGWHLCHFCGTYVRDGYEYTGDRHWLSDCRPDLVEHEPGETCTWWGLSQYRGEQPADCYAYQDLDSPGNPWTDDHKYFYKDGPM